MLLVHPSDEAYGSDRVLLRLASGLTNRGWRVQVLLDDDQPLGWLSRELVERSIPVRRSSLAPARRQHLRLLGLPGYIRALVRARRWIRMEVRRVRPSVIHINTSALLVAAILGRPSRATLVWHVHELVIRPRLASWIFRLAPILVADRVIAVSRAVRDHVSPRKLRRAKVAVVWNGIEDRPVAPGRDVDRPVVAFVGRLNRWKGWDIYLDAVARIALAFPAARFLVVGDPPSGEGWRSTALRNQVSRLGLQERVEILPFDDDVPRLFDEVSIVVVPSVWPEPFGLVALEGMRAGCAVIATAHGGALDLIEPGTSGLLVPPGDPAALADGIGSLLADPDLRARLGDAARARAISIFSEAMFLDGIERVYADARDNSRGQ